MADSNWQISFRNILRISLPMMIMGFSMTIVNLTDTAFLGRVGAVELGGAGNAGLLYLLLVIIGMGFSTGVQIIIARRNGEENYGAIGSLLQHSILFLFAYGILLCVFFQWFVPYLLPYITTSKEVEDVIIRFLSIRSWGVFFNFTAISVTAFFVGITNTKIIGIITPIAAGLNIFLDYCLIFGNFGFPEMGVEGAALASNIAEGIGSFILCTYLIFLYPTQQYRLLEWQGVSWDRYRNILKISAPLMAQNFISFFSWFVFFTLIEQLGDQELAASHIVRSIYMVLIIPVFGLGDTANSLTSNLIGQGKIDDVLKLVKNVCLLSLLFSLAVQPLLFIFGSDLLIPFTSDPSLIELGYPVLKVVFSVLFLFGVVIIGFRTLSGTGKTLVALIIEIFVISFYLVVTYLLTQIEGVALYQVWYSEYFYFGAFGIIVFGYLWKGNWKNAKI